MKRLLSASLFLLLVLSVSCGPSPSETVPSGEETPQATVEFKTPLPQATEARVVPTPTPVPPPPTPTPRPTPTPARGSDSGYAFRNHLVTSS
jgi:hypothetical protein